MLRLANGGRLVRTALLIRRTHLSRNSNGLHAFLTMPTPTSPDQNMVSAGLRDTDFRTRNFPTMGSMGILATYTRTKRISVRANIRFRQNTRRALSRCRSTPVCFFARSSKIFCWPVVILSFEISPTCQIFSRWTSRQYSTAPVWAPRSYSATIISYPPKDSWYLCLPTLLSIT